MELIESNMILAIPYIKVFDETLNLNDIKGEIIVDSIQIAMVDVTSAILHNNIPYEIKDNVLIPKSQKDKECKFFMSAERYCLCDVYEDEDGGNNTVFVK